MGVRISSGGPCKKPDLSTKSGFFNDIRSLPERVIYLRHVKEAEYISSLLLQAKSSQCCKARFHFFTILYFYPFRKLWYIISPSGRYINTPKGFVNLYNDDKQDFLICLSYNDIIISVIAGSDILKNNVKLTLVLSYIPDFLLVLSAIFVCVDPFVGSIIGIVLSLYLLIGYRFRFQHIYCFWQSTFRSKKRTPNRIEWFRISKFVYVIFPLMLLILYGVIFGFAILGD